MRILIINTFPIWGGDENWTINLGRGLKSRGHHVVIAAPRQSETIRRAQSIGLDVHPFFIGPDIAFWKIPPLLRFLKKQKIEVVLCVQNRDVKIAGLAARLGGVRAIFGRQGLDTIKRKLDHKIAFTKFLDGIITNTRSIKELYEGYGWFPGNFIHVVYDGLTLPGSIPKIDLHKEFDLVPGSKVIIGTGRLAQQKRFDLLIKVAKIASDSGENWSIIVAGTGDLEQKLKKMADDEKVGHIIKFVGFRTDVLALMNAADLFVLSSDSEGMSNALREAMAVGSACVATDVYGVEELFQDGKSGIKVKRGDAEGIFNAIKSVFDHPDRKAALEQNASKIISDLFSMDQMVEHVEDIFSVQLEKNSKRK